MKWIVWLAGLLMLVAACAKAPARPGNPGGAVQGVAHSPARREAVFTEVENDVQERLPGQDQFSPAAVGQVLEEWGEARSGEASKARLDLRPDGTVVRLGPNTYFVLESLPAEVDQPFGRLKLVLGQVWIILANGQLEVDTEWGVAGVRGSMMSVAFDPKGAGMRVTCLEGHCALSNPAGAVELTAGQASVIEAPDRPPAPPEPLTEADVQQWKEISPEARQFFEGGPPPDEAPPPESAPPPGGQPPGEPSAGNEATTYSLTNNCPEDYGVWHWVFEGPTTVTVDIPPGATEAGTLPPGDYQRVYDYMDNGISRETGMVPAGGHLEVEACPGN